MVELKNEKDHGEGIVLSLELSDSRNINLFVNGLGSELVEINFYLDEERENELDGKFEFTNDNDEDEHKHYSSKYKLAYMYSPIDYCRMGIGQFILEWMLNSGHCTEIYTSDPFDLTVQDSSKITEHGVPFVFKMRKLGLISDPDAIENDYSDDEDYKN